MLRNVAHLSAVDTAMISSFDVLPDARIATRNVRRQPAWLSCDLAQKGSLLFEDEFILLGEIEVGHGLGITAKARAISFGSCEIFERNQRERDVVGTFMRHPVADEIAAAFRNDCKPSPRILLEHRALERIQPVTDENGDGHG